MKNFFSFLKNIRRALGMSYKFAPGISSFLLFITIILAIFPILQSRILASIINELVNAVSSKTPVVLVGQLIALYAGIWALSQILNAINLFLEKSWQMYVESGLDLAFLKKRTEIDLAQYENPVFQNLLNRAAYRGVWPLFNTADGLFSTFGNLVTLLVASIAAVSLSWPVFVIIFLTAIPRFIVEWNYGYKMWSIGSENSDRQRLYYSLKYHIQSRLGIVQNRLLQAENYILKIIKNISDSFRQDQFKVDRKRMIFTMVAGIISAIGYAASFFLIIQKVYAGTLGIGMLVFMVTILGSLISATTSLLQDLARQRERNLYLTDIFAVFDTSPYIQKPTHPVQLKLDEPPKIEFKDVWFRYEGKEDWVLRGISMIIKPAEKIALIGDNGAGKSTIVKLLARIYDPTKGKILINGIDLRQLDLEKWGSTLSILLQDYIEYDLKTVEAIAMGQIKQEISKERAERAAILAEADPFIQQWPAKYDQQLGREFGGEEPSKGQRQKLALSRVLYRDSKILILDEPTSAVDSKSEAAIFNRLEEVVSDKTLILISHRFNTVRDVDTIFLIEDGKITEEGSHHHLIKLNGSYAKLFREQAKGFRDS